MSTDEIAHLLQLLERRRKYYKLEYYKPYKYQQDFHGALGHGTTRPAAQRVLMAGNGTGKCVSYRTLITHPDGTETQAGKLYERGKQFSVLAWDGSKVIETVATHGVLKPPEQIYRIYLSSGEWLECAANHRVLLKQGVYSFVAPLLESLPDLPASNWGRAPSVRGASVRRWFGKLLGCLDGCFAGRRPCDEQPQTGQGSVVASFPSQGDALQQPCVLSQTDGAAHTHTNSAQPAAVHRPKIGAVRRGVIRLVVFLGEAFCTIARRWTETHRAILRLWLAASFRPQLAVVAHQDQLPGAVAADLASYEQNRSGLRGLCLRQAARLFQCASCLASKGRGRLEPQALLAPFSDGISIIAYRPVGVQEIYDFTVPETANYIAGGVVHHNTVCGGMETAIHLTGKYPDWWRGFRFDSPIVAMIGGMTNEAVRDICQKTLFGDPNEPSALGSGTIPVDCIGKRTSKPGVPNAYDTALIKHVSGGWSKAMFRAYEQGPKKHMGHRIHLGWLDEEPPQDIWSQYLRATISMNGILYITFTPESGLTEVVNGFMNNLQQGQALIQASWNDAGHLVKDGDLTDEAKQLLAGFPPHERDMRMKGTPTFGAGLIFPFSEDQLKVEPFEIPRHWPQIVGIDFGYNHPFGAANLAWDRDSDVVYVTSVYRESGKTPPIHAAAVLPWGKWKPVAWPHDGLNTEKGTGDELRLSYKNEGLNLLPHKATNPPDPAQGQKEGEGGNSTEASLLAMYERMESGRFKVFSTCRTWFEEQRIYHRDEQGKIVKLRDDVISASRYAHMMLRHARTETVKKRRTVYMAGASNWG